MGYEPTYHDNNITIREGKVLDIEGTLKIDGTAVGTTATELNVLDGAVSTSAQASKAVIADANKKINLGLVGTGAAVSASGLLMGVGTSANPVTTSTADAKFIEVRAETTATSGDNRLAYLRYSINGATGGE